MRRANRRKERKARGFLVDENMPAEVSDYIAARGFRVAHIGRHEPHLEPAPAKGTEDARLKKLAQDYILITLDKRLLAPGAFPNQHRGVFVIDAAGSSPLIVTSQVIE